MYTLVIGNRNYSSWSLRAWLYMHVSGLSFTIERLALFDAQWSTQVERLSPAGRVPILLDGERTVWDSLAIVEYLREREPSALGWPDTLEQRAHARSITAEMHSGFMSIRAELPQNLRRRQPLDPECLSESCRKQIRRVSSMWRELRQQHAAKGPWLFGQFSIADVFYVPVALRFASYGIGLAGPAQSFVDATLAHPSVAEWMAAAKNEPEHLDFIDEREPVDHGPLILG